MANQKNWTKSDIPSQNGKLAIVTGATGGLGYETALLLAEANCTVILLGRNDDKGKVALENIKKIVPNAKLSFEKADLGSLASVAEFCKRFDSQHQVLDILINNAGIQPSRSSKREVTIDGIEAAFQTNHLSHFALTAQLLPALRRSSHPRVVAVSSLGHRTAKINFEDLQNEKKYNGYDAYQQSKLCNLLFTLELQRKSEAGSWGLISTAAHPGYAMTDMAENNLTFFQRYILGPLLSQSSAAGALPTVYAATAPEVTPGGYYGPNGFYECKGTPAPAYMTNAAKDPVAAKKLWDISVSLSKVTWPQQ